MSHEGGGLLSMMKGWAKFKPPPNFVQKEEQLKTMDPGEKLSMEYLMEQLDILISKSHGGTKAQYETIKADLIIDQKKSEFSEGFVEDFILWILGRSCKNIKYDPPKFDPNGQRIIDLEVPTEITPWGNTPYTHLDDVKDFLDQIVDNRMAAIKYIAKLKLRYPRNLADLWFWWKYIVHKQGVDGAIINYARWLEPYDFIPPSKIPYSPDGSDPRNSYQYYRDPPVGGMDDDDYGLLFEANSPAVTKFNLQNPNPPPYSEARAFRLKRNFFDALGGLDFESLGTDAYVEYALKYFNEYIERNEYAFCQMDFQNIKTRFEAEVLANDSLPEEEKMTILARLGFFNQPDQKTTDLRQIEDILKHHMNKMGGMIGAGMANLRQMYQQPVVVQQQQAIPNPGNNIVVQNQIDSPVLGNILNAINQSNVYLSGIPEKLNALSQKSTQLELAIARIDSTEVDRVFKRDSVKVLNSLNTTVSNQNKTLADLGSKIAALTQSNRVPQTQNIINKIPADLNKDILHELQGLKQYLVDNPRVPVDPIVNNYILQEPNVLPQAPGVVPPINVNVPPINVNAPPVNVSVPIPESLTRSIENIEKYLANLSTTDDVKDAIKAVSKQLALSRQPMLQGASLPDMSALFDKAITKLSQENAKSVEAFTAALKESFTGPGVATPLSPVEIKELSSKSEAEIRAEVEKLGLANVDIVDQVSYLRSQYSLAQDQREKMKNEMAKFQANLNLIEGQKQNLANLNAQQVEQIKSLVNQNNVLAQLQVTTNETLKAEMAIKLKENDAAILALKNENSQSAIKMKLMEEKLAEKETAEALSKQNYEALLKRHELDTQKLAENESLLKSEINALNTALTTAQSANVSNTVNLEAQYNLKLEELRSSMMREGDEAWKRSISEQMARLNQEKEVAIRDAQIQFDAQKQEIINAHSLQIKTLTENTAALQNQVALSVQQRNDAVEAYKTQQADIETLRKQIEEINMTDDYDYYDEEEEEEYYSSEGEHVYGQQEAEAEMDYLNRLLEEEEEYRPYSQQEANAEIEYKQRKAEEAVNAWSNKGLGPKAWAPAIRKLLGEKQVDPQEAAALQEVLNFDVEQAYGTEEEGTDATEEETEADKTEVIQAYIQEKAREAQSDAVPPRPLPQNEQGNTVAEKLNSYLSQLIPDEEVARRFGYGSYSEFQGDYQRMWDAFYQKDPAGAIGRANEFMAQLAQVFQRRSTREKNKNFLKDFLSGLGRDMNGMLDDGPESDVSAGLSEYGKIMRAGKHSGELGQLGSMLKGLKPHSDVLNFSAVHMGNEATIQEMSFGNQMGTTLGSMMDVIAELETDATTLNGVLKHYEGVQDFPARDQIKSIVQNSKSLSKGFVSSLVGNLDEVLSKSDDILSTAKGQKDTVKQMLLALRSAAAASAFTTGQLEELDIDHIDASTDLSNMPGIMQLRDEFKKVLTREDSKNFSYAAKSKALHQYSAIRAAGTKGSMYMSGTEVGQIMDYLRASNFTGKMKIPGPTMGSTQEIKVSPTKMQAIKRNMEELDGPALTNYMQRTFGKKTGRTPMTQDELVNFVTGQNLPVKDKIAPPAPRPPQRRAAPPPQQQQGGGGPSREDLEAYERQYGAQDRQRAANRDRENQIRRDLQMMRKSGVSASTLNFLVKQIGGISSGERRKRNRGGGARPIVRAYGSRVS